LTMLPIIYRERCNGCGLCIDACGCHALMLVDNLITITENADCGWCLVCEIVCPTSAIACPFEIVVEDEDEK